MEKGTEWGSSKCYLKLNAFLFYFQKKRIELFKTSKQAPRVTDGNHKLRQGGLSELGALAIHKMARVSGSTAWRWHRFHNDQICFTFLMILHKQLPTVHFRLEFPYEPALGSSQWAGDWFGKKVFVINTKRENKLKISPLGVLCFLSPKDNQREKPSQDLKTSVLLRDANQWRVFWDFLWQSFIQEGEVIMLFVRGKK